jgi:phenylacetate-coenzyme A ligase PaaK-like adenylate-forming protein
MRIKDTMPKSMSQKKRKTMGTKTLARENKDSPYFQKFKKERGMTLGFIKIQKDFTHLHNLDQSV